MPSAAKQSPLEGDYHMLKVFAWLFSVIFAFNLGAGVNSDQPADSELEQKIRDHMDVIVDETAAMVDDVTDELRKNEKVKEAEDFVNDVQEIMDNTKKDIDAHFGTQETTEEAVETEETVNTEETAEPEVTAAPAE
jgi:hypothetical protein